MFSQKYIALDLLSLTKSSEPELPTAGVLSGYRLQRELAELLHICHHRLQAALFARKARES